ncbi:MAG: D-amino acid dehydrogenase [Pseudomonadota bacterium]
MRDIAIIGAGITGITTAHALMDRGFDVTVYERHPYAAMETSFANGGQLSASNAEVWTHLTTVLKGLRWMLRPDAPLLVNPLPTFAKYSWFARFIANIPHYRANTIETARLAIAARRALLDMAEREGVQFDLEKRGILHFYASKGAFDQAARVTQMYREAGLEREAVTPEEMRAIEPALTGDFYGGFYTPSDMTGDIHSFTIGLSEALRKKGVALRYGVEIADIQAEDGIRVTFADGSSAAHDGVVVCAGIRSRQIATRLGDVVPIYPVKGYSITVELDEASQPGAPWVSLLDDKAKLVTSRLGAGRLRVAGTAEFNGVNLDIRADRIRPMVDWVRQYFPAVSTEKVVPWAGLRPMMPSMMPRVGAGKRPGVFYNTGHGHLGWTLSGATAEIVAETALAATRDAGQAWPVRHRRSLSEA